MKIPKKYIKDDGNIYWEERHLGWDIECEDATLDGDFSADELIWIGNHMKKHYKKEV